MADNKKKGSRNKETTMLPNAWQSVKRRNENAQTRANIDGAWSAVGVIAGILLFLFVILGGVSQTGAIKTVFNWSHNVGERISNWMEGGSIVTNDDGIYWDPTGQQGDSIKDSEAPEVENPAEILE